MLLKKDSAGFTLIEVIVAITLIAILAGIAVPMMTSMLPNIRLKGAARDLYGNMQKARLQAVKKNRTTAVFFDTANSRYQICSEWDSTVPVAWPASCVGTVKTVDFTTMNSGIAYGHGSATQQADDGGSAWPLAPDDDVSYTAPMDNVVTFNSQGLGTDGYVYMTHKDNTTSFAVGSLPSGVVRVLRWRGNAWQ